MADTKSGMQEFEKAIASTGEVASFERHNKPLMERVQHALHSNPALVPLIVLVLSILLFVCAMLLSIPC